MKRITLLLSLFFIASVSFGQSYYHFPEDLDKLTAQEEAFVAEKADIVQQSPVELKADPNDLSRDGTCPDGTFMSNAPDGGTAYTSSTDADLINYQYYNGADMIGGISFWAIQGYFTGAWAECTQSPMDIQIKFYQDNSGLPGTEVFSETVSIVPVPDPDVTFGTWTVKSFTTYLNTPVSQATGWFSVAATNSPTCWILVVNSTTGTGANGYYNDTGVWTPRDLSQNYCFLAPLADDDAPAAPTAFTVTAGAMGALSADLAWTNPALTFNGETLTDLDEIKIMRDGAVIHTITDPVVGAAATYTDSSVPEASTYTYAVYGVNTAGEGPAVSASAYIGEDVPEAPGDVTLVAQGNDGHVSWTAPTEGLNGGYFTPAGLVYTVVRHPDMVEVATDITATEYLDDQVPSMGNYFYSVTASNDTGDGGTGVSNTVLLNADGLVSVNVGEAQTIPAFRVPFDLWYNNSLAQSIYYPDELGNIGGSLQGVIYYNQFTSNLPGEAVRIYAATTTAEDLTGGFLSGDIFTLVFEGPVDFPAGENEILIPFDEPFLYTGGNLVLMTNKVHNPYNAVSGDRFFNTETPERPNRTRSIQADGTVYDPLVPPTGGTNRNWVPNTTLLFSLEGMGALEGTVVDGNSAALEGVTITIEGTNTFTMSDEDGEFAFPYLPEGEHTLIATKVGYVDVSQDFTIVEDQTTTVSLTMIPSVTVTVSGFIASDLEPETGVEGAIVNLTGYADFSATTDENGNFSIEGVFANQTYTISVTYDSHIPYSAEVVVGGDDLVLADIILEYTDIIEVVIGDGELLTTQPYNMVWHYSLQQTLYYPEEIGLGGGVITGIQYVNSFDIDWPDRHIQIWLGETELEDLSGGWADPSTLELVFDGMITFPAGVNDIYIPFDDIYIYGGGNLVIYSYKMDDVWQGSKNFFNTNDPNSSRTRRAQQDNTPYDVANPPAGAIAHSFPNITMFFSTAGLGALEGTVTDGTDPLEGVMVKVLGTNSSTMTDADGSYEFPYLLPETYNIEFSKFGYETTTITGVVIEEDETTVQDVALIAIPTFTVSGTVTGNDDVLQEGALVTLEGYDNFSTVTDADGEFTIEDVFEGTYVFTVSAVGYEVYVDEALEVDADLDLEIEVIEIIVTPFGLMVDTDNQEEGNALFMWNSAMGTFEDFEGGSIPADWSQVITNTVTTGPVPATWTVNDYVSTDFSPFGTYHAGLWWDFGNQNEWLISPEVSIGPNFELEFWSAVFLGSVNADHYYVKISVDGGTSWTELWDASAQTGGWNYYASPFVLDLSAYNGQNVHFAFHAVDGPTNDGLWYIWFIDNVSVGPEGDRNTIAMSQFDRMSKGIAKAVEGGQPQMISRDGTVTMPAVKANKAFMGFNVFLDGEEVASEIDATSYMFTDLEEGDYTAGVQSVYSTGESEIVTIPFSVVFGVPATFTVTTNSGDSPEGAHLVLTNQDHSQYVYEHTVGADGVAHFESVRKGMYTLHVAHEDYHDYIVENIDIQDDFTYTAELVEIIVAPWGLMVEMEDLDEGDAYFSWNNTFGDSYFFDSFEDGTFDAWHEFIQGPGTPGETGLAYWHTADYAEAPDGAKIARADWGYNIDTWLISPLMSIDENTSITFNWASSYFWSVDPNPHAELMIKVSTDGGNTWAELWNWQEIGVWVNWTWYETTVDLDAYAGTSAHVAIHLLANDNAETMIDAITIGLERGTAGTTAISQPVEAAYDLRTAPQGMKLNKAFVGYNVFLNDTQVATEITETSHMFTDLPGGIHTAGVQSVYTSGVSEIMTIDFEIEITEPDPFPVTFTVTDETEMYQALRIKGNMTDPEWIDVPLTQGDNHVWTVTLDVLPGSYEWGVTEDDGSNDGIWLLPPGDNLMFTVDAEGNVTGTVSFVIEDVSTNDLFAGSIRMYPNPARETVTLLSNVMMKEVRMLDLSGRVVYHSNVVAEEHQLNVRGFESGIYFVQIITEEGILTGKLQIQK